MRKLFVLGICFLFTGLAVAQVNVIRGYASNQNPPAGYPVGFVPLINTPTASFDNSVPGAVGASNATAGNVAGASNATMPSVPNSSATGVVVWYQPSRIAPAMAHSGHMEAGSKMENFGAGDASIGDEGGLAQVIGKSHAGGKATRTYTNQDIPGPDPNVGTVKIHGKVERLP